jgi:hypothetical protein
MRVLTTCFVSLLAAACGNVSGFPDAGPGIDSTASDSGSGIDANPRGLVKVTVLDPSGTGAPVTGVPVVFIEPDGKVAARIATDSNGKAEAMVLPGSNVTAVVLTSTNRHQMTTITEVQPGDDLVITRQLDQTAAGTFTVNFPAFPGATSYYIGSPCGGQYLGLPTGNPPFQAQLTFNAFCKPTGNMTVSAWAYDDAGGFGYLDKANVAVSAGATNLTGAYQIGQKYTANFTNIPTTVSQIYANRWSPDLAGFNAGTNGTIVGGASTITFNAPTGASAVAQTHLQNMSFDQQQDIYQTTAGNALSYNLDVGANALPWLGRPVLDTSTGVIAIPVDGTGTGDLFRVAVTYYRSNGTTNDYYDWEVYGPTAKDITLPQLPIEAGDVNPKATDMNQNYGMEATLGDSDAVTGYDAVRNHACQIYLNAMLPYGLHDLGASTKLRVSYFSAPG